ncbi:pyridoxal phosphate homeostasis protein-like [Dysidea avara]|uniref:pyridoxal phosphate homeostasis protein-like n=1 Tax=Dysidea avara TaxID=196820 RepID=UPI00332B076F
MSTALKELSKFTNVHMCSFRSRSFTVMVNNKRVDNEVLSEVPGTGGLLGRIVRVNSAIEKTTQNSGRTVPPRLVAVSKRQPVQKVQAAYAEGLRHFGENYVQELRAKARNLQLGNYNDIKWHFIGHLQCNKIKALIRVSGLWMVESVDSIKLAHLLNKHWGLDDRDEKLNVMVQVNTNREEGKSGCSPEKCLEVAQFISEDCESLNLSGVMTIGKFGHDYSLGPNPDFLTLINCRQVLHNSLAKKMELSMGMSDDFIEAISYGSTNVRVGTAIFGPREQ